MTKIIKKPWGFEYCAYESPGAAIWVLHIVRGQKTSYHCHPNKRTRLIPLTEGISFTDDVATRLLKPLEVVDIPPGIFHQSDACNTSSVVPTSENGVWLLEIEEPNNKRDIVRKDDAYGREGRPIESDGITYTGELLRLAGPPMSYMGYRFSLGFAFSEEGVLNVIFDNTILGIKKEQTMKVSDYVANFIADLGIKHVFSVSGGGSMHLIDSIGKHERLEYVATHHEQSAAMAAEAYSRINGLGCALFTTGPGGTNAITGVACAWVDSIPVIYLSGQVTRNTLMTGMLSDLIVGTDYTVQLGPQHTGLRQFGVQESDIVTMVKSITKYAVTVTDEKDVRFELEKAAYIAKSGRPGPVWIDLPLDINSKQINPALLRKYHPNSIADSDAIGIIVSNSVFNELQPPALDVQMVECLSMLKEAKRPVLIVGNGVRLAGAEKEFLDLVNALRIPVVSSWAASDMIGSDNQYHVGHCGIFGDRASNFTVQNADLLLVIGCRLSVPQIGYNFKWFAREAKIIMVDIDHHEIDKPSLDVEFGILADAKSFITELVKTTPMELDCRDWRQRCMAWKEKYQVCLPEYAEQKDSVNSFYFIDQLSAKLPSDAVVVVDTGTSFTCTFQAAKMRLGQRWINDFGHASMGYALPGAIGACLANGRKKTICIVGDGSLQMNIQELATIRHLNLPIIIFVINNGGYLAIRHTQANHFGRFVGEGPESGLGFPDTMSMAVGYDLQFTRLKNHAEMDVLLGMVLNERGPYICEIMMAPDQPLVPRLSSLKRPDGSIASKPLEDLYPFLPRDEFKAQMIVPTVEVLE